MFGWILIHKLKKVLAVKRSPFVHRFWQDVDAFVGGELIEESRFAGTDVALDDDSEDVIEVRHFD